MSTTIADGCLDLNAQRTVYAASKMAYQGSQIYWGNLLVIEKKSWRFSLLSLVVTSNSNRQVLCK